MADKSKLIDALLNYTKNASNNIETNLEKLLPANARLLSKSIVNPSSITEKNFTKAELDAQKQAVLNAQQRANEMKQTDLSDYLNDLRSMEDSSQIQSRFSNHQGKWVPVQQEYEQVVRHITPTVQYPDYPVSHTYDKYGVGDMPVVASFKDPAYAMSTAIGRTDYKTDPQGNVHITDQYNFPRSHDMKDYQQWSWPFKLAHILGEKYSQDMPVDINLGKLK